MHSSIFVGYGSCIEINTVVTKRLCVGGTSVRSTVIYTDYRVSVMVVYYSKRRLILRILIWLKQPRLNHLHNIIKYLDINNNNISIVLNEKYISTCMPYSPLPIGMSIIIIIINIQLLYLYFIHYMFKIV